MMVNFERQYFNSISITSINYTQYLYKLYHSFYQIKQFLLTSIHIIFTRSFFISIQIYSCLQIKVKFQISNDNKKLTSSFLKYNRKSLSFQNFIINSLQHKSSPNQILPSKMIYTRDKDSYKTKTVKSTNSTRQNTVSENGFNLVEELKQRIENKHKTKTQPLSEDKDFNTQKNRRSKSSKKITISKNLQPNIQNKQQISISSTTNNQTEIENKRESLSQINPFSKIKKESFMQLIDSSSLHNQNKSTNAKSPHNQKVQRQQIQAAQNIQPQYESQAQFKYQDKAQYFSNKDKTDLQNKQLYESPIQHLKLSQYSSNGRRTQQNNQTQYQSQGPITNKQIYENKVKKWKTQHQKITQKQKDSQIHTKQSIQNNQHQEKVEQKKQYDFSLNSGVIRQAIIYQQIYTIPKISSIAQKEYTTLLQTEISELKTQLSTSIQKIKHIQITLNTKSQENHQLKNLNTQLTKKLSQTQRNLNQKEQSSYLLKTYERLFTKMRNLHILNAMELIQTKNFLQVNFNNSKNTTQINSYQQNFNQDSLNQKLNSEVKFYIQDFQSRIESINQCIAKVQETIQVTQKVIQVSVQRVPQSNKNLYISQVTVKELEQSLTYKDKIIKKLKEDLKVIKSGQKYSSLSQTRSKISKQPTFITPYSYVDEIHLLRHQITRLTQQNCHFYQQYFDLKKSLQEQNARLKRFPNQSRIQQIVGLINKLDKNQQKVNSKVQYWVNGKTGQQTNINSKRQNKGQKNKTILLLQKPTVPKFQKKSESESEKEENTQKVINYHSIEKYSINSKDQKMQFSREEFAQLVKEFKSSLSGSTPQKKSFSPSLLGKNRQQINEVKSNHFQKEQELLTFRTPKQQSPDPIQILQHHQNHQENLPQQNYPETISRLQYEKEFLASQRENLLKENQNLIEKISDLEKEINSSQKITILKEQIYKLKLQNQDLVERIVESQNLLLKYQQNKDLQKQNKTNELLKFKQNENSQLRQINSELQNKIKSLQTEKNNLTKTLESTKSFPNEQQTQFNVMAPSFESLINFLRRLPEQKREYHGILLKMIQRYQNKVSQLRQENVIIKTKQKTLDEILIATQSTLQKVMKFISNEKLIKEKVGLISQNGISLQQQINKLVLQVKKSIFEISETTKKQFSQFLLKSWSGSEEKKSVSCWMNRINYHLMFLRSLIQGIGESDLELIQGELSDYLKQLRKRIPTVLEKQQYEESNMSSLNSSLVNQ